MDEIDPLARREAAAWHARLQSRSVSNEQLERFYEWREVEGNARAFAEIDHLWLRSVELRDDPEIIRHLRNAGRTGWRMASVFSVPSRRWLRWAFGFSALAVLSLVLLIATLGHGRSTYRTGIGERLAVRLEDGSRVTLNTASRITVRLSSSRREVSLDEGQVLFEVAHDRERPFSVVSRGTRVTAIGTVFEVSARPSGARVVLIQGKVSVETASGAAHTRLDQPGETLNDDTRRRTISRSDPAIATSWINGKIDLRDVPLEEAIAEVNRYTERRVILDARRETGTKVSGTFATGDSEAFAAAVAALLPVRQSNGDNGEIHLVERR